MCMHYSVCRVYVCMHKQSQQTGARYMASAPVSTQRREAPIHSVSIDVLVQPPAIELGVGFGRH